MFTLSLHVLFFFWRMYAATFRQQGSFRVLVNDDYGQTRIKVSGAHKWPITLKCVHTVLKNLISITEKKTNFNIFKSLKNIVLFGTNEFKVLLCVCVQCSLCVSTIKVTNTCLNTDCAKLYRVKRMIFVSNPDHTRERDKPGLDFTALKNTRMYSRYNYMTLKIRHVHHTMLVILCWSIVKQYCVYPGD